MPRTAAQIRPVSILNAYPDSEFMIRGDLENFRPRNFSRSPTIIDFGCGSSETTRVNPEIKVQLTIG